MASGKRDSHFSLTQFTRPRRQLLLLLKSRGPQTIACLAQQMSVTSEAVRQQVLQLQRDGWIEPQQGPGEESPGLGRPATRYGLSSAAEGLFPKLYPSLAAGLLQAVRDRYGVEGLSMLLGDVARKRIDELQSGGNGKDPALDDFDQKLELLKSFYFHQDPFMETEGGAEPKLIERNCPLLLLALEHPEICSVTLHAMQAIFGAEVIREKRFQWGDGYCQFRIHRETPTKPDRPFEFEREPEKS